jgi:hypothetical protein
MGYIDLIIYNKKLDEYTIFDIKTSTKGWSKWEKGDKTKHNQLYFINNIILNYLKYH